VRIVCGDTKVVEHGSADGMYITTSGIGKLSAQTRLSPRNIRPGDMVLVSGTLGDHSIAVLSVREGIEFRTDVTSDVQPLNDLAQRLLSAAEVRCMRDPTRGGLAGLLNELAESAGVSIELDENCIPVTDAVRAACDVLGLDPIYAANEGKLVAIVSPQTASSALQALRTHPRGHHAATIGHVEKGHPGRVTMRTAPGGRRIVDMPVGEQLPRIC
jgi:hydrogenase expression/formation protein HypE